MKKPKQTGLEQILSKMKNKLIELDVDFIGGQGPLTKEEEKAISEFIKAQKLLRAKKQIHTTRTSKRQPAGRTKRKVVA